MELNNKKILITGGCGFIGSHIVDQLLRENVKKITIVDNFTRGTKNNLSHLKRNKKIKIIEGDIRSKKLMLDISKNIDCIFHEAAIRLTQCAEDPRLCHEIMVDGTFNILEAAAKNKVKKLIMASSASVYGEPLYVPMDEKHPYNNTTFYGAAKIANEHMAFAFHAKYGIPIILLRYFNVYGPRMDILGAYTEVIIRWLEKIDAGKSPIIHGDGKQSLDFVFVEDIAQANILAAKSNLPFGIYNVGSGKTTSLKKLLNTLTKLTGSSVKPIFNTKVKRPYVQKRQADVKKAKKELKFKTSTTLRQGLKKLIQWRKERLKELQ